MYLPKVNLQQIQQFKEKYLNRNIVSYLICVVIASILWFLNTLSKDFLTPNDNILFVDDFLAYGNAALGVLDLIKQSGANLVGMGFIIEKAFQNGRKVLEEQGVRVESLAIIEDLSHCSIKIKDQ